ncbi:MAG: SurA N-terminal domain-containing protein [Nitrospirota bacterium]|nr:SurA N-terminal domain-containing protein [Nitrospirota bacterium]
MTFQNVVTPVKTGVQRISNYFNKLDSGVRRNDRKWSCMFIRSSLVLALAFLPAINAHAEVIDRILAIVNGDIITRSDLDDAIEVNRLRNPSERRERPVLEKEILEELVDRRLLVQEARRLMISEISAEEIDDAVRQVKAGYTDEEAFRKALADADMTEADMREQLKDQLLIRRFIERRIRLMVRVDMEEVKRFFEANKEGMGDQNFREFRDELREFLIEKKTNERLEEYRKELREKADIRFN